MIAGYLAAAFLLLGLAGVLPVAAQPIVEQVVSVPLRNTTPLNNPHAVTVRYLALGRATGTPRIAVILFAGGNGLLDLGAQGAIGTNLAGNFLVRSRTRFAKQGFFVAVVDTPGQVAIDGIVRLSPQYAADNAKVIADVRARSGATKVWLIGTSTGTLSVAGIAAQAPVVRNGPFGPRGPFANSNLARADGIVLTSTLTTPVAGLCGKTVFDASLAAIRQPAFVVAHRDDGCACTPAGATSSVLAALTQAATKARAEFTGGDPPVGKDPCMAMTPHGFLGIEDKVVAAIATWIRAH